MFTRLLITFVFILFSTSYAYAEKPLRIGISQFPHILHPGIDSMMAKSYVLGFTTRPLTVFNLEWQRVCLLCTELPTLENGSAEIITRDDGRETIRATYSLRDDAYWGDGVPVTTDDVLFSWAVGKHPAVGISNAELYTKTIEDITVVDDKTFTITFDKLACEFNDLTDFAILPKHLEGPVFDDNPDEYRNRTLYNTVPETPGLYNGPYLITKRRMGESFTLAPNPHWQGDPPRIENITIRVVENTTALGAQLLSGSIDMIAGELGLNVDQALGLAGRLDRRNNPITFTAKPGLIYEHIELRLDTAPFDDVRVRRALLMAIDRDTLVSQLFGGHQEIAHSNIHPLDTMYQANPRITPFDMAGAAALLDAAGCPLQNGRRVCANGTPMRIVFQTTAGNQSRERVQQFIQSAWQKLGIEVTLKNETPRVLFSETMQKRQFEGAVMFAWLSAPRSIPKTTLHSSMIPREENGWSGQNFSGHASDKVDQIIDALEVECDAADQTRLWGELQDYYTSELPALPLYFRAETHFIPNNLQGVRPTGHQFPSPLWAQDWHFDEN